MEIIDNRQNERVRILRLIFADGRMTFVLEKLIPRPHNGLMWSWYEECRHPMRAFVDARMDQELGKRIVHREVIRSEVLK